MISRAFSLVIPLPTKTSGTSIYSRELLKHPIMPSSTNAGFTNHGAHLSHRSYMTSAPMLPLHIPHICLTPRCVNMMMDPAWTLRMWPLRCWCLTALLSLRHHLRAQTLILTIHHLHHTSTLHPSLHPPSSNPLTPTQRLSIITT
jgi:hypothetical protein